MLEIVWNVIVEFGYCVIEAIVLSQAVLINPSVTIVIEKFSVEVISNSTTILHFSYHVSDGFP